MSIYTGIGGTAKATSKLYLGVNGKARQLSKIYLGVGGTAKLVYASGTPLGSLAVGTTVLAGIGDPAASYAYYIVVHQGNPNKSIYDASCNGTWLMRKLGYTTMYFANTAKNAYPSSLVHSDLQTHLTKYNSAFRSAAKQIKIPYTTTKGYSSSVVVHKGSDGLSAKMFLPSCAELGIVGRNGIESPDYVPPDEGTKLSYFASCPELGADPKRVCKYNGRAVEWWTRSMYAMNAKDVQNISSLGSLHASIRANETRLAIRPFVIMDPTACVDESMHIIG